MILEDIELLNEKEKKALECVGEGHCLTCYKKIPKEAYYCGEECEKRFNGKITIEMDKWSEVHDQSVTVQSFFEFLSSKHIHLCTADSDRYDNFLPIMQTHDDLIYEWLGIDKNKLEQERKALLRSVQQ